MVEHDRQLGNVSLTEREWDILRLLTNGLTDREIAEALILTLGTVKWYNRQIYNKLGVRNRTEAVTRVQQLGLPENTPQPIAVRSWSSPPWQTLPQTTAPFVGREKELAELAEAAG